MWNPVKKMVIAAAVLLVVGQVTAQAQEKLAVPSALEGKPIELVVPWGTGGGSDQMARALARAIEKQQPGVTVAVLNKPGGNGTLGLSYALSQPANGRTLALITNDFLINHAMAVASMKPDDFQYIARVVADVEMLFVRTNDTRFDSFAAYARQAKAKPGSITIATAGANGVEQLAMTLVNKALGIEAKWIPFDKPAERIAAFLGGHVDLMVEEPSDMKQYIDEGKMKPLVQLTDRRTPGFPNTPTAKELGADVTLGVWRGLAVKRGTDAAMHTYLEKVVAQAVSEPEFVRGYIEQRSLNIRPGYLTGKDFERTVGDEYQSITKILK